MERSDTRIRMHGLPEDLLWGILAYLPLGVLLKFCSVCKTWKEWVQNAKFLKLRAEIQKRPVDAECMDLLRGSASFFHSQIVARAGGFILLHNRAFHVLEPSKPSVRPIPDVNDSFPNCNYLLSVMSMVVNPWSGGYHIIALARRFSTRADEARLMYDSSERTWHRIDFDLKRFTVQREGISLRPNPPPNNAMLYQALNAHLRWRRPESAHHHIFHYEENQGWKRCPRDKNSIMGDIPRCISPQLMEYNGHLLFLVSGLARNDTLDCHTDGESWEFHYRLPDDYIRPRLCSYTAYPAMTRMFSDLKGETVFLERYMKAPDGTRIVKFYLIKCKSMLVCWEVDPTIVSSRELYLCRPYMKTFLTNVQTLVVER